MENGKAELTELERVKMENFALKHSAMQQQQQANLAARAAYIRQIEAAHPGYRWNEERGLVADGQKPTATPQPPPNNTAPDPEQFGDEDLSAENQQDSGTDSISRIRVLDSEYETRAQKRGAGQRL